MTASSDSTNLFTGAVAGHTARELPLYEVTARNPCVWHVLVTRAGTAADAERLFRAHLDAADETASPREGFRSTFKSENICELDRDGTWFERFDGVIKPGEVQVVAAGHHG
jgi:hypothetical protein